MSGKYLKEPQNGVADLALNLGHGSGSRRTGRT